MAKEFIPTVKDIKMRKVSECIPYEDNPRINDDAVNNVATAIKEFGFNIPIVLDADDVIITGHTRRKAAIKLKMAEVPTITVTHLTEAQVKAFRIADNRLSELAEWDENLLAKELGLLSGLGFDVLTTGFSQDEINELLVDLPDTSLDDLKPEDNLDTTGADVGITSSRRVGVSVGTYKLYMSREDYHKWESDMLEKHGTKADVSRAIAKALGIKQAELGPNL